MDLVDQSRRDASYWGGGGEGELSGAGVAKKKLPLEL